MTDTSPGKKILILGIGNYLMGDEGIGIHAVRYMQEHPFPPGITLLDGGTGGFHLLSLLQDHDPVIIIDATIENDPTGTIRVRKPRYASDFPRTLGAHDIGLRDLIESAALLESLPAIWLVTIAILPGDNLDTKLSPPLKKSLPFIEKEVRKIISRLL